MAFKMAKTVALPVLSGIEVELRAETRAAHGPWKPGHPPAMHKVHNQSPNLLYIGIYRPTFRICF
jgi:hypothetical protein